MPETRSELPDIENQGSAVESSAKPLLLRSAPLQYLRSMMGDYLTAKSYGEFFSRLFPADESIDSKGFGLLAPRSLKLPTGQKLGNFIDTLRTTDALENSGFEATDIPFHDLNKTIGVNPTLIVTQVRPDMWERNHPPYSYRRYGEGGVTLNARNYIWLKRKPKP